jgi:hypothetical protein
VRAASSPVRYSSPSTTIVVTAASTLPASRAPGRVHVLAYQVESI